MLKNINKELQTLFYMTSNLQQYFLHNIGVNYYFFKTMSSGRLLINDFGKEISKSLKKSPKLNKSLVNYYYSEKFKLFEDTVFTHTYIKPLNKKNLILFNAIQSNHQYYETQIGFHKYYKINYKTARRIKKKIKKNLISQNFIQKPYLNRV